MAFGSPTTRVPGVPVSHHDGTDRLMQRLLQGPATSVEIDAMLPGKVLNYTQTLARQLKGTELRLVSEMVSCSGRMLVSRVRRYRLVKRRFSPKEAHGKSAP